MRRRSLGLGDDRYWQLWDTGDGLCRHPHAPRLEWLPTRFVSALECDPGLMEFYCSGDKSFHVPAGHKKNGYDSIWHAYRRDVLLMIRLATACPYLTRDELLQVLNEFPIGMFAFAEWGVEFRGGSPGDKEYVEELVAASEYPVRRTSTFGTKS